MARVVLVEKISDLDDDTQCLILFRLHGLSTVRTAALLEISVDECKRREQQLRNSIGTDLCQLIFGGQNDS